MLQERCVKLEDKIASKSAKADLVTSPAQEDISHEEGLVRDIMLQERCAKLEGKLASMAKKGDAKSAEADAITEDILNASGDAGYPPPGDASDCTGITPVVEGDGEEISAPPLLRAPARRTDPRPGALAVSGPGGTAQEGIAEDQDRNPVVPTDEENPTAGQPTEEPLLNARLVEEESEIVEAKPALEGFAAIVRNHRFKYVAAGFLLILLGVLVPLAVILPKQGDDAPPDVIIIQEGPEVCGREEVNQADYRGNISMTEGNLTCQRWDSNKPHTHKFVLEDYTAHGLEENYCRNPDGVLKAWCYTTSPLVRWQYCNVPYCNSREEVVHNTECGTLEKRQGDYRGTINVTATGKRCQRWDSQVPHRHQNSVTINPSSGLEENYCRNPDGETFTWCYTEDPDTRWEYCDVPLCGSTTMESNNKTCSNCTKQQCGTERLQQSDYRGKVNTTRSGYTCQRWDSQQPHKHYFDPEDYPDFGLEENYCRNPKPGSGRERWTWCVVTNPFKWFDFCDVPFCEDDLVPRRSCGTASSQQLDYRGGIAVSKTGKECLPWHAAPEAIVNKHTPKDLPWDGLIGNYCRNPGNSQSTAWCYVAGGASSWEFCDVPDCQECGSRSQWKEDYRGTVSTTIDNQTCQHWADVESEYSHHPLLEENYCRNPDGDRNTVWCHTDPESLDWEYCDVPDCAEETKYETPRPSCGSLAFRQSDYRGQINQTASGRTCQPWNSQTPHAHKYISEEYPAAGLDENYCRQPDDSQFLAWCFVDYDSSGVRWEYCDIPICEELSVSNLLERTDCGTKSLKQKDYTGNISTTLSGWTCQEWGAQYPHEHRFSPESYTNLLGNACRNPDGSYRAWCFTTNPDVVWEYCDIPICQEGVENP